MLLSILSILLNIAYVVVLNISFYTDRAPMPTGQFREWQRSPVDRLSIADRPCGRQRDYKRAAAFRCPRPHVEYGAANQHHRLHDRVHYYHDRDIELPREVCVSWSLLWVRGLCVIWLLLWAEVDGHQSTALSFEYCCSLPGAGIVFT